MTQLKTQCESLLEKHEEDIEDWYFEKQDEVGCRHFQHQTIMNLQVSFEDYVCRKKALKKGEDKCLGDSLQKLKKKTKKSKQKGETGTNEEL